ncbi:hypothetical protein Acy02nite_79470 [Actinoplanes cyaneus]|uniref:Uncharacterized protein n=1 Tax=Actinoplanes cyaneus TaxID=52696 RepID=A0A919IRT7_9ACTN|nr:hypothetical protein Acy02nite_79470 [Actinoplanes cyaneus]
MRAGALVMRVRPVSVLALGCAARPEGWWRTPPPNLMITGGGRGPDSRRRQARTDGQVAGVRDEFPAVFRSAARVSDGRRRRWPGQEQPGETLNGGPVRNSRMKRRTAAR